MLVCLTTTLAATLAGCERGPSKVAPAEVTPVLPVSHPIEREVTDFIDYTGRTNARHAVTIQPRVTGYLLKMPFKEGADVKKGELLFEIDPRPYQAQLKAAEAAIAQNVAGLKYAKATNERFKELNKKQIGAVSERELDQYQAQEDQAIANLDLAKANLLSAQLNLEWTKVVSPIDGYISRYYLTVGNLVNQDVTQLTTVVSVDPMDVYFDMDEPTLFRIKQAINDGKISLPRENTESVPQIAARTMLLLGSPLHAPLLASSILLPGRLGADMKVMMGLPGDDVYRYEGTINFFDNQVNPGTGSISVRGRFENPRVGGATYLLAPGMFVRVRLPIGDPQQELLVIDRAVTSDQGLKYVYVIDADNKVEARRVTTGSLQEDGLRVITQGLKKDDWVLVGGLQQVQPRRKITPEQGSMPSLNAPAIPVLEKGAAKGKQKGKK
jgi:multidrug efflux system membrane fusion protein